MRDLFCRILRGESVAWPAMTELDAAGVFETAQREGLHLLIAHRFRQAGVIESCPRALRARFEAALRDELATEQITRRELREVIAALHAEGVSPLLFKGAALAVTHYPDPALRPRIDVDLLTTSDEIRVATAVFERLGYRRSLCVTGELVSSQVSDDRIDRYLVSSQIPYSKIDRYGVQHAFDLHWRISIPQVFANLLSMEELVAGSLPVPSLGEAARSVGPVHALAIACIHRVAHHRDDDRLIWLYDIHLLAGALRPAEPEEFLRLADDKKISAVCGQALSRAHEEFGTRLPSGLLENLRNVEARNGREPSAAYLHPDMRKVDVLLSDLVALKSSRQRWRLLREHVFPPAAYVQKVYGVSDRALLPVFYAWRFIEGARAWFRQGRASP